MKNYSSRKGFTLAEVLITLAIVGIIAVLTIPTLISNYKKKQTVAKLKQTYSLISQALMMAQVNYGDTSNWEVSGIYGTPTSDPNFDREKNITVFTQKYFIPYLKIADDYGYTNFYRINYDGPFNPGDGSYYGNYSMSYFVRLSNNVIVAVTLGNSGCIGGTNPDGSCVYSEYRNILFKVDVNGFAKPNTLGKDVFYMTFDLKSRTFKFYSYDNIYREDYLNFCGSNSGASVMLCGYLIFLDGWEIKDDYPWF